MKAVVLCPGPSLGEVKAIPECDVSIAVNRAIFAHRAQWWMVSDYPVIRDYPIDFPVKICTNEANVFCLPKRVPTATEVVTKEQMFAKFPYGESPWTLKTATSALVLAAWLGATQIDVYGCDMKGLSDWDGHQYSWEGNEAWRTRDEKRWADEAMDWMKVCEMLEKRGAHVERKQPAEI